MNKFGNANGVVRTNQGGELARCNDYRCMMAKEFGYTVKPTGTDSASQNGGTEIYNNMLAIKVHILLYGLDLPEKFWSAVLLHTVYLYKPSHALRDWDNPLGRLVRSQTGCHIPQDIRLACVCEANWHPSIQT